jgi:hypothetical protein
MMKIGSVRKIAKIPPVKLVTIPVISVHLVMREDISTQELVGVNVQHLYFLIIPHNLVLKNVKHSFMVNFVLIPVLMGL